MVSSSMSTSPQPKLHQQAFKRAVTAADLIVVHHVVYAFAAAKHKYLLTRPGYGGIEQITRHKLRCAAGNWHYDNGIFAALAFMHR